MAMSQSAMSFTSMKGDLDVRIEDYLNDKLQTSADLASIDTLLRDLGHQHDLLEKQMQDAKVDLAAASSDSQRYREDLLQRSAAFEARKADIDRRLLIVTQSETSDDAIHQLEDKMSLLRRLEVGKGYFGFLERVENLTLEARNNFSQSPKAALQPYLELQKISNNLKAARPAAEDAAPHLVDHVDDVTKALWSQMKASFANDFEKVLKKIHWPGKDIVLRDQGLIDWEEGVRRLLDLQSPELHASSIDVRDSDDNGNPPILLPLEVMVKPLELRFKYHFEGDRPTNKFDKPEYFLSHVEGLLSSYDGWFAQYLQPLLQQHFRKTELRGVSTFVDSTSALITALLPMLRHKIFSTISGIAKQPQLLSHFIHELMGFDVRLRDDWNYDGGNNIPGWKGLTWEVLNRKGWFERWLEVEKDFALNRYKEIINQPESHEIDYDSVSSSSSKATYAAIRVNDLLETITDRYRPLTSFSQKLRFLIEIQIEIFDLYHGRLFDSLSKYQVSTSSIGRTIQGDSKEAAAEVSGLRGIERLCRIYGSAEYLEHKMRDWSDDGFFVELYDELQDRVNTRPGKSVAGSMSVEAVAERTSSTVNTSNEEGISGALFDETANSYRSLRTRTESALTDTLISSFRETLRPYGRINPWSSLSSFEQPSNNLSLTAELDATVQQLRSYFSLLAKTLALSSLRRIGRQVTLAIQAFLWDSVLMRYTFSRAGIVQFTRDVEVLWETLDRYLGPSQGAIGMRRLRDALVLMGLPMDKGTKTAAITNDASSQLEQDDDDNAADDNAWDADDDENNVVKSPSMWEVEKRIFRNNESAREVLEELNLEALSEMDARHVMERIIEINVGEE